MPDYIEMISLDSDASEILPESVTLSWSGRDLDQNATSDSLPACSGDVEMGVHEGGATGAYSFGAEQATATVGGDAASSSAARGWVSGLLFPAAPFPRDATVLGSAGIQPRWADMADDEEPAFEPECEPDP